MDTKVKNLPVTLETFWNIQSHDRSGRAFTLYTFYSQAAIKQNSSQPLASDLFCSLGLHWSLNTVIKTRKILMTAGAIEHFRKKSYHYVRVNYLTIELQNKKFDLSENKIQDSVMGTIAVFDYYKKWYERIEGCLDEFTKRLKKRMNLTDKPDLEAVSHYLRLVYDRINEIGYGIQSVNCELAFWYYLIDSVANELRCERIAK